MLLYLHGYNQEKITKFSLQFSQREIEVDLLLSPNWENKEEYYSYLEYLKKNGQKDKLSMYCSSNIAACTLRLAITM